MSLEHDKDISYIILTSFVCTLPSLCITVRLCGCSRLDHRPPPISRDYLLQTPRSRSFGSANHLFQRRQGSHRLPSLPPELSAGLFPRETASSSLLRSFAHRDFFGESHDGGLDDVVAVRLDAGIFHKWRVTQRIFSTHRRIQRVLPPKSSIWSFEPS